jgi:putative ubiquitin-RnfH superfamily antitoxin RatB of RatAB toxin-antitoxin module
MARLKIEVVYALRGGVDSVTVMVPEGTTVRQAIESSGILARHPQIDLGSQKVGVYGELRTLHAAVSRGDRIEIYRPLELEPKEARRRRALRKP